MNDPQIIPLQFQWRVFVDEHGLPHLEIELEVSGWSRDFVAEMVPKSFAAKLILEGYRAGFRAGVAEL